eukprot:682899-Pyramimonas_sp.AAC.1
MRGVGWQQNSGLGSGEGDTGPAVPLGLPPGAACRLARARCPARLPRGDGAAEGLMPALGSTSRTPSCGWKPRTAAGVLAARRRWRLPDAACGNEVEEARDPWWVEEARADKPGGGDTGGSDDWPPLSACGAGKRHLARRRARPTRPRYCAHADGVVEVEEGHYCSRSCFRSSVVVQHQVESRLSSSGGASEEVSSLSQEEVCMADDGVRCHVVYRPRCCAVEVI